MQTKEYSKNKNQQNPKSTEQNGTQWNNIKDRYSFSHE